jgi:hypothetical protein
VLFGLRLHPVLLQKGADDSRRFIFFLTKRRGCYQLL